MDTTKTCQTLVTSRTKKKARRLKPNPEECLYHADPESFLPVMKELGRVLEIPDFLYKRGAMAVCSCRTSRTSSQRMDVAELQVFLASCEITDAMLLSRLKEQPIVSKTYYWRKFYVSLPTVEFVENSLHEASIYGKESPLRFVAILKMALKSDFSLLQEELVIGGGKLRPLKNNTESEQISFTRKIIIWWRGPDEDCPYRAKFNWSWNVLPNCWPL
ncbi:hypothetical protein ElyMa_001398800 [Elysia marginata]|uniref:Uncharacterized protein n=1 Tax=Elysia marginata TaxID=1093978 RepID=A0AAV4IVU1_9GAST|nr:hypothetical protein ElyMa_001398800 [Elysia marginata]